MESFEKESPFHFHELFFSRTNPRGIIISGNSVFQRVSQYDWNEVLQKPHSLIRHPRMPRGVFHLLWETIQQEQMIGAYVVNRAKNGSHYWVFALVLPIEDGYLSIRLKPSSPIFSIVREKYAQLLETENLKALSPQNSNTILQNEIRQLGFESYREFMIEALVQELQGRQSKMDRSPIQILEKIQSSILIGKKIEDRARTVAESHYKTSLIPLNLEVQAAKLGREGATIATISSQYESLAGDVHGQIREFVEASKLVRGHLQECQLNICNSILQKEIGDQFLSETENTPIDKVFETNLLIELRKRAFAETHRSIGQIEIQFEKFKRLHHDIRKLVTALEIVNISGRIEAAKIKDTSVDLVGMLNDLDQFKTVLKSTLKEIDSLGYELMFHTHAVEKDADALQ